MKSVFFLLQRQHWSWGAGQFDSHLDTESRDVVILFIVILLMKLTGISSAFVDCFLNVHKNCRESVAACGKVTTNTPHLISKPTRKNNEWFQNNNFTLNLDFINIKKQLLVTDNAYLGLLFLWWCFYLIVITTQVQIMWCHLLSTIILGLLFQSCMTSWVFFTNKGKHYHICTHRSVYLSKLTLLS